MFDEEINLDEDGLRGLFNKLKYLELEQLINTMKFEEDKYNYCILVALDILEQKNLYNESKPTLDVLEREELLFIYNIVTNISEKLESVRYLVGYNEELYFLNNMEFALLNKINSKKLVKNI